MDYSYLKAIDEKAELLDRVSDTVWDSAELAFTEFDSAACLEEALRQEGFEVEDNLAGIKTAFSGRFGKGKPVIGVLGEFDALSGLGQEAGVAEKRPNGKTTGHGCGHNLLGAGSLGAAIAVKRYLEESGSDGTVIYYGCPGEEGGSGKAFMARDRVFDELDAAVSWHPGDDNRVWNQSFLANYQILFKFDGIAAHAGGSPHMGRSALDAVELLNVGVQFLREHVISSARIHYAITNAGGISPNVVQPHAEVLYLIRAPKTSQVQEIYERILKIAAGAALMTETKESHEFIKACSNLVPNDVIQREMQRVMEEIAPPVPTEEDLAFARDITENSLMNSEEADRDHPIAYEVKPYAEREGLSHGSTDVGDVSWCCPMAQMSGATWCRGTPDHSWQVVTQGKSHNAHEQTRYAAKIMAATMVNLMKDPELLAKAKEELKKRVGPAGYVPPIPEGVKPRSLASLL